MLDSADIELFFSATLKTDRWSAALETLSAKLAADGATLVAGAAGASSIVFSPSLTEIVGDYLSGGLALDSRETRVQPQPGGGFLGDFDSFSAEEIERDAFYRDFLRPRGFGWHAAAQLAGGSRPLVLSLKRHWRRGPFQRSELRRISRALPHLRGAARLAEIALTARGRDLLDALADKSVGGVLLDDRGRVVACNVAVPDGDGLTIVRGHLTARLHADQAALDRIVGIATSRQALSDLPPSTAVLVHRPSGRSPYLIRATRLVEPGPAMISSARALVQIMALDRAPLPAATLLASLYNFTPRESELALEIAGGASLTEAAVTLRISREHARQRLKLIFAKTGLRRQADLVALLQRLA